MVLKFRDATIAKQGNISENSVIENLRTENNLLRDQIESNPTAAKLFVENNALRI